MQNIFQCLTIVTVLHYCNTSSQIHQSDYGKASLVDMPSKYRLTLNRAIQEQKLRWFEQPCAIISHVISYYDILLQKMDCVNPYRCPNADNYIAILVAVVYTVKVLNTVYVCYLYLPGSLTTVPSCSHHILRNIRTATIYTHLNNHRLKSWCTSFSVPLK